MASAVEAHGFSRCHAACGILIPRTGIELVSPALTGRFLTGPPGKSTAVFLMEVTEIRVQLLSKSECS